VVEVFIAIFGEEVPSDGVEEIQRLHEHAEGGVEAVDPQAAALLLASRWVEPEPGPTGSAKSRARRPVEQPS
jgi:hypothetical protein